MGRDTKIASSIASIAIASAIPKCPSVFLVRGIGGSVNSVAEVRALQRPFLDHGF